MVFVCESCGLSFVYKNDHDEEQCAKIKRAQEEQNAEYARRLSTATAQAIDAAKNDKALRLLLAHGLIDCARERAEALYDTRVYMDFGCGAAMNGIYSAMIEAARNA
jgi:hypothetical protein